ncbi:substrate-binding domain-containing protein, partial [Alteromonas sp. 14N.309.X.WAT.G.H12]|uniref:substrate-binding domain-containing protein n=1 Tax=Alteromonas sp. 14N.309.X.WAT.G.H12 TaxID=3120824 RepID=UPI002FD381FE
GAPRNPKLLNQLTKIKKTVVTADFNIPTAPSVNIDNTQAAYEVAKVALNATATKPVILGLRLIDSEITRSIGNTPLIDSEYSISHRRLDGYLKAIHEHGLRISNADIWHIPESTQKYAKSAVEKIFSHTPLPDTLLCMSDVIALTAMQEALKRGLRVPDDIRIVGFDGIDEASRYHPTLTTVQQFNDKKGALAAQLYLTQEKENRLLPFELVEGNSTSH